MDKFVISSTGLSMNYMPHYIAKELGVFSRCDLGGYVYRSDPMDQRFKRN